MKFISTLSLILSRVAVLQVLWEKWDIRSFLIASFTFQLFLILAAPFRKRTSNLFTHASLWASYLLADWVAAQAIGLIIKATEPGCQSVSDDLGYLFSFWAQFLLIHLGGPDTITALALEDNELWLRTSLHLGVQAYGSLGVLFRSTRSSGLWAATVLMFLAGIIKYVERVMSLFQGRLADFKEVPDKYLQQLRANEMKERLSNVEMVRDAFNLFHCHKSLFADRILFLNVQRTTRKYFMRRTPEEAYKLLEIQLNFTYEAIYTKMVVIHKTRWKILRHVVLSLEVAGLVIWCLVGKQGYPCYDIRITYALVVGAIAVDAFAFLRIQLSDWSIARLNKKQWWMIDGSGFYNKFLAARTRNWTEDVQEADSSSILLIWSWFRRAFLRRWSESIYQLDVDAANNIDIEHKLIKIFHLQEFIRSHWPGVVKRKMVSSDIWDFVFYTLRNLKNGDKKRYVLLPNDVKEDIDILVERAFPLHTLDENYIAFIETCIKLTKQNIDSELPTSTANDRKDISLALQRYLIYLLNYQLDMMFGATDKGKLLTLLDSSRGIGGEDGKDNTSDEDEDKFQTLYNNAKKVVDEIKCKDEDEKRIVKWDFMARAWLKLLCYAAIKCRPNVHADKLKQGGEFLSFIWLLMVHLDIKNLKASSVTQADDVARSSG